MKINMSILLLISVLCIGSCGDDASDPNVGANIGPDRTSENAMVTTGTEEEVTEQPDLYPEAGEDDIYEWDRFGMPVRDVDGYAWVLNETLSDDFNYDFAAAESLTTFGGENGDRWENYYHSTWSGPTPTYWVHNHVWVADGNLKILASRPDDAQDLTVESGDVTADMPATYTACISSTTQVNYPAYIEARVKLSNSTMASDVWMLSTDDTQEIDICEAYGANRNTGTDGSTYYGEKYLHLSHHVFVRSPFQDYQPSMTQTWYSDEWGTIWREDFHRIGVYWRDPWNLEYYIDGVLVRVVSGESIIDPYGYTDGTGLSKGMDIIINMEDQSWRAIGGLSPTDDELANAENSTFNVDWIRIYELVAE